MSITRAYKFTVPGRRARFGITDYPPVGEWSESRTPVLCESGWHVPTKDRLAKWMHIELWEVEVKGRSQRDKDKSTHEYIRFVRRVESWNRGAYWETVAQSYCDREQWIRHTHNLTWDQTPPTETEE